MPAIWSIGAPTSGVYDQQSDAQDQTSQTILDLSVGVRYYFAVTAYNQDGVESRFLRRNFRNCTANADAHSDTDAHSHSKANSNSKANPHAKANSDANAYPDSHAKTNPNADTYPDSHPKANSHSKAYPDAHAYPDSHSKANPNADTYPDSHAKTNSTRHSNARHDSLDPNATTPTTHTTKANPTPTTDTPTHRPQRQRPNSQPTTTPDANYLTPDSHSSQQRRHSHTKTDSHSKANPNDLPRLPNAFTDAKPLRRPPTPRSGSTASILAQHFHSCRRARRRQCDDRRLHYRGRYQQRCRLPCSRTVAG